MSGEHAFIQALKAIATDPAARGLDDDAAALAIGGETLVLTLDTIVEGVHYLPDDPPADVAWKLVAVNVSDLAAKGTAPVGCLYSHALGSDTWDADFLAGLGAACRHFGIPLLGGDTVRMPEGAPRSYSLTALGRSAPGCPVPSRTGAKSGDQVWASGTIGDAGAGLAAARGSLAGNAADLAALTARYRTPMPVSALGIALAPLVTAMMDVSDGLLVDAERMARASGVGAVIELERVPLSAALLAVCGDTRETRLAACTAGDDYELLFTADAANAAAIRDAARRCGHPVSMIGIMQDGEGLALTDEDQAVPLPQSLGYQH